MNIWPGQGIVNFKPTFPFLKNIRSGLSIGDWSLAKAIPSINGILPCRMALSRRFGFTTFSGRMEHLRSTRNHVHPPNDRQTMRVRILGGGVIGLCCAYYLRKEGYEVTVIDRDDITGGCSFGNMGYISPSHFIPLASPGIVRQGLKWMLSSVLHSILNRG